MYAIIGTIWDPLFRNCLHIPKFPELLEIGTKKTVPPSSDQQVRNKVDEAIELVSEVPFHICSIMIYSDHEAPCNHVGDAGDPTSWSWSKLRLGKAVGPRTSGEYIVKVCQISWSC